MEWVEDFKPWYFVHFAFGKDVKNTEHPYGAVWVFGISRNFQAHGPTYTLKGVSTKLRLE